MASLQNFYTSRDNNANADSYVGQLDRLWYNPNLNSIYVSDGNTPGGIPVGLATAANAIFTNITVNGNVLGDLNVNGNISPASTNKIGGIAPGPGVVISNQGILTIDTANIPLSFGNFTASNNILSIVNVDEDMILSTDGNAEIQLIGNIGFYKPDGLPPDVANRFAKFTNDGQVTFYVPTVDLEGAVNIIGSTTGTLVPPGLTGAMLHVTGQKDTDCRLYFDGNGGYVAINNRAWNGNIATGITAIQSGDDVLRLNATAATSSGMGNVAFAQMRYTAIENQTPTAQGSNINFWTTAAGTAASARVEVANISVANGVSATKFTTAGTVTATGNITGGNITTPGTIRYDIGSNNATVTQLTSKSTAVTANGRTGQITGNAAALAQGTSVTFTVNNTFVSAADTIILNIKSGATADTYTYNVSAVNSGSFNIQLRNFTNTSRSDAVVFNFAVIKVS